MKSHKDMVASWKKDPKFKKAYDELEDEFSYHYELLKARTEAGLTQEEIAQKMGTKREAVTRLESSGKNSPSIKTLKKYAEAVGCKLRIQLVPAR
jgi:transcriptional regulator with XRE-family HTH domain